jgi:DNA repair exonuclease SbcCD nuclease subunit
MRLIHSSDLQIGMVFRYLEPEVAAVLLAGDIYDKQQLSSLTLAKPIEAMRQFPRVSWHLMPGNHDYVRENGLWDRLQKTGLPENVHLHTKSGKVVIAEEDGVSVFLLPAPLNHMASAEDLTAYMDEEPTAEGAIRIGMAHGSIQGFGSEGEARNYISPDRAGSAGLAYLALGDWHRQIKVNDRTWYSGTPEPDQFRLPPDAVGTLCNGGSALLVELAGPRSTPEVTPIEIGKYRWHQVSEILIDELRIDSLEARLRALERNLATVVLDLQVTGTLSLADRKRFEEKIVRSIGAAVLGMRRLDDAGIVLEPTEADMDEIDRSGFVRVAANRLRAMKDDASNSERARLASLALRRLYLEHLRGDDSL